MEGNDADAVPARHRVARTPTQVRAAAAECTADVGNHSRVRGAGALQRRTADRLHLDRQPAARRSVPRPVSRRRHDRQAAQAPHQQHAQPRDRGTAVRVLAERLLAGWAPAGVHGAASGPRRAVPARRPPPQRHAPARHRARPDDRSVVVAGRQAHRVRRQRGRLQQPVHDRRRREELPPAHKRLVRRTDAGVVARRAARGVRERPRPRDEPRAAPVRQVEDHRPRPRDEQDRDDPGTGGQEPQSAVGT